MCRTHPSQTRQTKTSVTSTIRSHPDILSLAMGDEADSYDFPGHSTDRGHINRPARLLRFHYRGACRPGVPADAQIVTVVYDECLAVESEVGGAHQLAQLPAFAVQDPEHAGARGLFRGEFPTEPAPAGSAYHFGLHEAGFELGWSLRAVCLARSQISVVVNKTARVWIKYAYKNRKTSMDHWEFRRSRQWRVLTSVEHKADGSVETVGEAAYDRLFPKAGKP
jgi:hypothetical protein